MYLVILKFSFYLLKKGVYMPITFYNEGDSVMVVNIKRMTRSESTFQTLVLPEGRIVQCKALMGLITYLLLMTIDSPLART